MLFSPLWRVRRSAPAAALMLAMAVPALAAARPVEKRVPPEYPVLALRMRISGVVTVTATVDADGHVTAAKADHGNALLAPAAVAAVRKWKFAPAAEASTETIDVTFDLGS